MNDTVYDTSTFEYSQGNFIILRHFTLSYWDNLSFCGILICLIAQKTTRGQQDSEPVPILRYPPCTYYPLSLRNVRVEVIIILAF